MKDKGIIKIEFSFEELRELSNYKYTAYDRFIKDIEGVYDKLIQLNIKIGTNEEFTKFVLFTEYTVSIKKESVIIQVNDKFKDILNSITGNFTKFELKEFTKLRSSYSKTAYRLLKQYRTTGYYIVQIDEFRRIFDVPKSYRITNITTNILDPIKNELGYYFNNLRINKIKGKGKRKRFIEYIEFNFSPQNDIKKDGKKTFRKENGEYYENHIYNFTEEEAIKTYPEIKPLSERKEEQLKGQQKLDEILKKSLLKDIE
ncbi:MAG: replication initiation protein [Miniphocaeibacter sp.]|uniref:replication initiation protein n=1 Tax=Miniphocaeibacter sp. TaxID=3100973 RepID=UPI001821E6FF|nr:replication initiation protein [Gallicola sp.]